MIVYNSEFILKMVENATSIEDINDIAACLHNTFNGKLFLAPHHVIEAFINKRREFLTKEDDAYEYEIAARYREALLTKF